MSALVSTAYRLETGLRAAMSRVARRRGWVPALLSYPGYGGGGRVRVLARVLLAPPGSDPASRRGIRGWRRFLTLEVSGTEVDVEVAGVHRGVRSDDAGLVDVTLEAEPAPGRATATVRTGPAVVDAPVHVAPSDAVHGIVCDVDDTVWITGLQHPLRAAWRTMALSSRGRQAVPGMAGLLRGLVDIDAGAPVIYLSNGAWNLAGPVTRFLDRNGFPAGALLMTDWGITPTAWFRDGRAHKGDALERVTRDLPWVRWVLVGDDGEHDPSLYADLARRRPDRVAAIALREVAAPGAREETDTGHVGEVPVVRAPDGDHMLLRLRPLLASGGTGSGG